MKNFIPYQSILLLSTVALLSGCIGNCPKNYTSTIRSIMKPMKENLQSFFIQEQSYPSTKQRDTLLEASGCKILNDEQRTCSYKGVTFSYDSNKGILYPESTQAPKQKKRNQSIREVTPQEQPPVKGQEIYTFAIVKEDSLCTVNMTSQGEMLAIECIQHSCLKIDP